jgi:hypothetical protein
MDRRCSTYGREGECINVFGECPQEKKPLERHIHRREDNIKLNLRGTSLCGMD